MIMLGNTKGELENGTKGEHAGVANLTFSVAFIPEILWGKSAFANTS
jgi:hypothetical protein